MRKQVRREFAFLQLMLVAVSGTALAAPPDPVTDAPKFKFDVHGIVGASFYVQSNPAFFLNGQGPLMILKQNASGGVTTGADARQSRLNFTVTGPDLHLFGDAKPKAVVEQDFFGLNSPGGYGEVSALQRLRLAYAELNWGDTQLRFGQDWELLFNGGPVSLGHLAYPVTYFAGLSGWREPGIGFYHTIHTGDSSVQLAAQMIKSDWENPFAFGANTANVNNVDAGQLSGLPGFEVRVKWAQQDAAMAYVAAHWSRVGGSNAANEYYLGAAPADSPLRNYANRDWDVLEAKLGAKWNVGPFALQADFYAGQNVAPLVGESAQFNYTANDVHEVGGWLQAGYYFCPSVSLWGVAGTSRSNVDDVSRAGVGRYANTVAGGMLQYKEGGFGIGPELYFVETKTSNLATAGAAAPDGVMTGVQYMLSAMYYF